MSDSEDSEPEYEPEPEIDPGIPEDWQPYGAKIETELGDIEVELYWEHCPKSCRNFAELTRRGYYDNLMFHRVVPGFVIQTGDPSFTSTGGFSIYGRYFSDEIKYDDKGEVLLKFTGPGFLGMANAGPCTNGSQYFFSLDGKDLPWMNGLHTLFGKATKGIDVILAIGRGEMPGDGDMPINPIKVHKVTLIMDKPT